MAIHHSGSNTDELMFLSTPKLSIIIKGNLAHPAAVTENFQEEQATLCAGCQEIFEMKSICQPGADASMNHSGVWTYFNAYSTRPMFYEYQNYQVIIERETDCQVEFWHDSINIRNKMKPTGRSNRILSGTINFAGDIGKSDLVIRVDGSDYLKIGLEVFPTKLHYQEDYLQIMADITDEVYNLVFEFLKRTYMEAGILDNTGNSPTEFFSIIYLIYKKLIKAADVITAHPHHTLQSKEEVVPAHKVKRANPNAIRWNGKHPQYSTRVNGQIKSDRTLAIQKYVAYDIPENRFAKSILQTTKELLSNVQEQYVRLKRVKDKEIIKQIETMKEGLNQRLNNSFFRKLGVEKTIPRYSMVFTNASGYRQLYQLYILMRKGLSLKTDIFHTSVKELSTLYEYWCFIKLNSILKKQYCQVKQDIIKIDDSGLFVVLRKGASSTVKYVDTSTGDQIELTYNPMIKQLPTTPQRPDQVLTFIEKASGNKYEYIFDAKYRINPALEAGRSETDCQTPGPMEEDINTMHRYRDVIVVSDRGGSQYKRRIIGAYVLFPYENQEEYINHKFYQSIEKVNIGGLPFLPSATSLVEKVLAQCNGPGYNRPI